MTETVETKLNALVDRVRNVRRWLVTLAVLKVAALCLIFVSVYVGLYAWFDHRLHFGSVSRIIALTLLAAGIVFLLYRLTKLLLGHISCSRTANYIESKKSFDQQLVTAIEYYEKKQDYPYSVALAEHLVLQMDKGSKAFRFDSTVAKWQGYIFAAIILFGLSTACFYIHDNYVYFSSYFTRLVHPLAAVEPLPPTTLESITTDIVAEPNSVVTLAARIKGRVPEFGKLVLDDTDRQTADKDAEREPEETLQLQPGFDEEKRPKFEATRSFAQPGRFRYRFEADAAFSPWHNITISSIPKIKSIIADVKLDHSRYIRPYTQEVKDYTLEVVKDSFVTLTVEATEALSEAVVTDLDGDIETKKLTGTSKFDFRFIAKRAGFIEFSLSSAKGVSNENMPSLQVMMKIDEPAKFKLLSPDGDYLATNVASVPVAFEVTDDFGLNSAIMYLEIAGQEPIALTIPVEKGAKSTRFTHTLELEEHNLNMGDSILFYTKAADIDTGSALTKHSSSSDVYFIEIRPYRQRWHQQIPRLPGQKKQGLKPPVRQKLEFLISILEYTRAILKKTWVIANKPKLTQEDSSRLDFINKDVQYCAEQLTLWRDKFDDSGKAVLGEIIGYYDKASKYLTWHKASKAIGPEKDAYRVLRKFIIELEKCLPGAGTPPPKQRDKIKLEEQVHLTRYEKERIEWELKQLAQKLAEMVVEQKRLKKIFENFLKQQTEKKNLAQKITDEESWISRSEKPSEGRPCSKCGGKDPNSCPVCSDTTVSPTVEGALKPPPKMLAQAAGENQGQGKGQGQAKAQGSGKGNVASAEERIKMLQAQQRALQEKVSQLRQTLQELPEIPHTGKSDKAAARKQAQEHLDEAIAQMNDFQTKLAEAYYKTEVDETKLTKAVQQLDVAKRELDEAKESLESGLALTDEQMLAKDAAKLAEQFAELADALDGVATDAERKQMLARLEEVKRQLEATPEWQSQNMQIAAIATDGSGQQGPGGSDSQEGALGSGASNARSTDSREGKTAAHAARLLARQFWSIAIDAKRRQGQLIEDEPSDAKFYELESEFFENAAKNGQRPVKK